MDNFSVTTSVHLTAKIKVEIWLLQSLKNVSSFFSVSFLYNVLKHKDQLSIKKKKSMKFKSFAM